MRSALAIAAIALAWRSAAQTGLDRPWISDTYFYWYEWDYERRSGNWLGGVYNTPLFGYYDSRRLADNLRELHCAAEWGITHHFMDFWGHAWMDEKGRPRERCLFDAAEELLRRGYDCWMSIYQDATDFQMDDFAANGAPDRHVGWLLSNFSHSPAWPRLNGKPLHLVYGRNGAPKVTATDDAFRRWLQEKYGSLERLRERWKTPNVSSWDDVRWNPDTLGVQRADSILYQYHLWSQSWAQLERVVGEKYGLPGVICSFDIAYQPFRGWGYSLQTKTFCGPHSYGGIFGQPHDQDAERFIQAAVAKWYGSVFFDTFKNFYHDWEIRYPGICFPPEPCHFDRFWAVALSHYAEALLHLSWNEWWEGSNLEPCHEYGKTYCEKNLLYATIMKACFPSIDRAQRTGTVAVLLNDWHWLVSGLNAADIYGCIQALRAASVDFKLLPDDFVTPETLRDVRLVVAPTGLTGLGYNAGGQPICDVLWQWLQEKPDRRLVIGYLPDGEILPPECGQTMRDRLRLTPAQLAPPQRPKSMNAFIDVGEEGDAQFFVLGYSGREDWSKLRPDAFGKREQRHTIRWCPGVGNETRIIVPLAPGQEHEVVIHADAAWPNMMTVRVAGHELARLKVDTGSHDYRFTIPAQAATSPVAELSLVFETQRIPRIETKGQNQDGRVCNLAIDWIHIRTPDQPSDRRVPARPPAGRLSFSGPLRGLGSQDLSIRSWQPLAAPGARVLSSYEGGLSRDMMLAEGRVWYCHGCLGDITHRAYWDAVLSWAGIQRRWLVSGDNVIGARLNAGETDILLAYNTDIAQQPTVKLAPVRNDWPLAEAQVISRDGEAFPGSIGADGKDTFRYYGVYQFAFCPVRPSLAHAGGSDERTRPPVVLPGTTARLPVRLTNLTDRPVTGEITLESFLPSLTVRPVAFSLRPREAAVLELQLVARDDVDWGRKTVCLVAEIGGRRAYFWRPLVVAPSPKLEARAAWHGDELVVSIVPAATGWERQLFDPETTVTLNGKKVGAGRLYDLTVRIPRASVGDRDNLQLEVSYETLGTRRVQPVVLAVPPRPPVAGAWPAQCLVYADAPGCPMPRVVRLAGWTLPDGQWELCDAQGRRGVVGSCTEAHGTQGLWIVAPSGAPGPFYLRRTDHAPPGDLRVETLPDGRLKIRNGELLAVLDPARGGTVTELRWRGGRNLADRSFGTAWGAWGRYDPLHPHISADKFLSRESKHYQWEKPAKVTVASRSPAHVEIVVEQQQSGLPISQRYRFFAFSPFFQVTSTVTATEDVDLRSQGIDEIVWLDIPLRRGSWTKIYPNFTGQSSGEAVRFHDGWREGPAEPPVATIMDHSTLRCSLSVLCPNPLSAVDGPWFRQGFFPEKRGSTGEPTVARLEFIERFAPTIDATWAVWRKGSLRKNETVGGKTITVVLHDGSQAVAEDLAKAGLVVSGQVGQAAPEARPAAAAGRADWWFEAYDARAPVAQQLSDQGLVVQWPLRVGEKWIDPATIRAVWQSEDGPQVLQAAAIITAGGSAAVSVEPPQVKLGDGRLYLYGQLTEKLPLGPAELEAGVPNPSFEAGRSGWGFAGAVLDQTTGHSGNASVRLEAPKAEGAYALIQTDKVAVAPNAKYRLALWAKTSAPGASLVTNFYANAQYDFLHINVPLQPDGEWHRYEVDVPTGSFPPTVRPALRIWVYRQAGPVWVDDVSLQPRQAAVPIPSVGNTELLLR